MMMDEEKALQYLLYSASVGIEAIIIYLATNIYIQLDWPV